MLLNLNKRKWTEGLTVKDFNEQDKESIKILKELVTLTESYNKSIQEEENATKEELIVQNIGKLNPKKKIEYIFFQFLA
jgi:26S proteasome regulatory subunit N11